MSYLWVCKGHHVLEVAILTLHEIPIGDLRGWNRWDHML